MEQIERFKKRRENRKAVKAYRDRRAERLAYRIDDEPEAWITVRGNHIPLDEERKPIGGQAKSFGEKTIGAVRDMAEKAKKVNAAVNDKIYQMEHKKESEGEYYSLGGNSAPDETPYLKYTPKRDDYQDADSMNDFIRKNRDALQEIYDDGGMEAVDREYYLHMMSRSTKDLKEINPEGTDFTSEFARRSAIESAMDDLVDEVGDSKLAGWTRNADSSYKPAIMGGILGSPKARNAALNLMYQNYLTQMDIEGGKKLTYNQWLTTPMTLYRGEHGQKRVKDDVFSAYSFDRKMAEEFGGDVKTIRIRPIDTLGSPRCKGEAEVFVPYWAEKKSLFDENDLRTDAEDGKDDPIERFMERRKKRLNARMDEEDTGWRTTDEGHKIHINKEGEVDKGNPYVLEKINGAKKIKSKTPKMFPRAGKNGAKHERLWGKTIDFINAQEEADPACADLFDAMQDHEGAFIYNISYGISQNGVDESKISRYVRRSDGVVTKVEMKVPDVGKFDSPGGYGTYIHEMTHVMDVTTYSDDGGFTREAYSGRLELPNAREQRAKPNYGMPDDVAEEAKKEKKLFADAADGYRKSFREAESRINEEYLKGPQTPQARLEKDYRIRKENDRLYNEYSQKVADLRKRYADNGLARMFDLYDALSAGEVMDSGFSAHGHGRAYYSSEADRRMEILANYVALGVAHPDMFKAFKQDQPKLCEDLDKMVREMAGRLRN